MAARNVTSSHAAGLELDELASALETAESDAAFVDLVATPGVPPELAAALCAPADPKLRPERLAHDRELMIGWVGRAKLGERLEQAFHHLGPKGVWQALALLERPDVPAPTASLTSKIERHRIALEVLAEIHDESSGEAFERYGESLLNAAAMVNARLRIMEGVRQSRSTQADQIRASAKDPRGARGPDSGPARLLRFIEATQPLADANWTRRQLAELVVESGRWTNPPCRGYVENLLDSCDGDPARAAKVLAGRINDAERRA